ncbi:MAG TPA: O-antigen ligase family protein [Thermoanaerobaculia bacterium]|nr:O-antigen ligase family protein [Thermoanaerobaculia bacterium]
MTIRKALYPLLLVFAFLTFLISPAYILFGILSLLWMADVGRSHRWSEVLRGPMTLCLGLQALFLILSTALSRNPAASAQHLAGVSLFLLLPIAVDLFDRPERARSVLLAVAANGLLLSAIGVWQFAHGGNDLENRITGPLSHYMTFSGLTMIGGCVLLGLALEGRGAWRWVGVLAVVPLGAMLLTFTRNAYVGILIAVVVYLALRRPRGLLWLVPALVLVFVLSPPAIRARIRSIPSLKDITNRDRISMIHAGARMIADDPFFGIGPEMVRAQYPLYRDPDAAQWRVPHLHDNAMQLAAASGLPEAAAYLAMMAVFFVRTVRLIARERRPAQSALLAGAFLAGAALFCAGFFEYNWGDTEVEMATLLVLAVPFSRAAAPTAINRADGLANGGDPS